LGCCPVCWLLLPPSQYVGHVSSPYFSENVRRIRFFPLTLPLLPRAGSIFCGALGRSSKHGP
jgi:hypothetical protein